MLRGLVEIPEVRIYGITDPTKLAERVPTFSWTWQGLRPRQVAERLAESGVCVLCGNHYALPFTEAAGLEPDGTIRAGALHYTTEEDVDRLIIALQQLSRAG